MRINVEGGTNAGTRPPYEGGHSPTCACSKCQSAALHRYAERAGLPKLTPGQRRTLAGH